MITICSRFALSVKNYYHGKRYKYCTVVLSVTEHVLKFSESLSSSSTTSQQMPTFDLAINSSGRQSDNSNNNVSSGNSNLGESDLLLTVAYFT